MFNEILTGKASLEPKPEPMSPYRAPGELPPVHHACITCGQQYQAKAGSSRGRCPTCHVAMVEANARQSAQVMYEAQENIRRAENSHRVVRGLVAIAIVLGIGVFKYGMKKQMREDAAVAAGYSSYSAYENVRDAVYPTDEYSYQVHEMAGSMCRCEDLKCARDVQVQFTRLLRTGGPSDDKARASVEHDTARLADCQAKIEAR